MSFSLNPVADKIEEFLEKYREANRFPIHQTPPYYIYLLEEARIELIENQKAINDLMRRVFNDKKISEEGLRSLEKIFELEEGELKE